MPGDFCRMAAAGAGVALFMFAGVASAQSTEGVEIAVSATVSERCGFMPGQAQGLNASSDLEDAHVQSMVLRVDCNTPFAVSVKSEGGRLTNRSASDDLSGYAFDKVYGFSLSLDTDVGQVRSGRCLSTALVEGGACVLAQPGGLGSGDGVAIGRDATLTVDWPAQSALGRRLAAGDYSDTITISIAARA
jgi:spore coat protein U-like protein